MNGFKFVSLFYTAMFGVPTLLFLISITSNIPNFHIIRVLLAILAGIGSILFGAIGISEVFLRAS